MRCAGWLLRGPTVSDTIKPLLTHLGQRERNPRSRTFHNHLSSSPREDQILCGLIEQPVAMSG